MGGVEKPTTTTTEQTTKTPETTTPTPTQTTTTPPCFLVDGMKDNQVNIMILTNHSIDNLHRFISRLFVRLTSRLLKIQRTDYLTIIIS